MAIVFIGSDAAFRRFAASIAQADVPVRMTVNTISLIGEPLYHVRNEQQLRGLKVTTVLYAQNEADQYGTLITEAQRFMATNQKDVKKKWNEAKKEFADQRIRNIVASKATSGSVSGTQFNAVWRDEMSPVDDPPFDNPLTCMWCAKAFMSEKKLEEHEAQCGN
jgi:hypothetical protein